MRHLRGISLSLPLTVLAVSCFGLLAINSVKTQSSTAQLGFIIAGLVIYFFCAGIDRRVWNYLSRLLFFIITVFLFATLINPEIRGSHRWIGLAGFLFQPVEFLKPLFVLYLASEFSRKQSHKLIFFLRSFVWPLVALTVVFKQPDFGNVIILLLVWIAVYFVSGLPLKHLTVVLFALTGGLPLLWNFLRDFQKQRLIAFFSPQYDPLGIGYNGLQALITAGSGGFFGRGLNRNFQSRLRFLPENHTDFIFSSLLEFSGFAGMMLIIILYLILFVILYRKTAGAGDRLSVIFLTGFCTQIFFQVLINMGMNLGIIPITGITLPYVSYGGSSLIANFFGLGLVSSLTNKTPDKKIYAS